MQELSLQEIDRVGGASKVGITIFGVSAAAEVKDNALELSVDGFGIRFFGITLPILG